MDKLALLHELESQYAFPVSDRRMVIRLRTKKDDGYEKIQVLFNNKYTFPQEQRSQDMELCYCDGDFDYYETTLALEDSRLAYVFRFVNAGKTYFYSESGLSETYDFKTSYFDFFQLSYINDADILKEPSWVKSAVFYEIFIDRFYYADKEKDRSYITLPWGKIPTNHDFAGGDIRGIIEKLDYLEDLGINALYLTPIFRSDTNHKYDTIDYFEVDPQFGTMEDLKELVRKAHEKGIRIVLDAVFNHCSSKSKRFQDVLTNGKNSRYHDWFVIHGDKPDTKTVNYETFADCNYMPKINTSNEEVQDYLCSIGTYYIKEVGIDGWRLDVSDEVSHAFWRMFRLAIKKANPEAVLIGENWHNSYPFLMGDQLDSVMNYAFTKALYDCFVYGKLSAEGLSNKLNGLLMRNKGPANDMMLNLLDSHDTFRFYSLVKNDQDLLLQALAILFLYVGMPCLYYGTEIPLEGGYDPDCRRCFDWTALEKDTPYRDKLKELVALRKLPAIQEGKIRITAKDSFLKIRREDGKETYTLYVNLGKESKELLEKGKMVTGNGYKNNAVAKKGYVIIKGE